MQKNNSISLRNNESILDGKMVNQTNNSTTSERSGLNLNNNILYSHSFRKRGRNFSINLNTAYNNNNGESYLDVLRRTFANGTSDDTTEMRFTDQYSNGLRLSSNISYTEPLSEKSQLQFSYNPSYSKNTFAFPLKFIKSNFNVNGGVSYSKQPGLINSQANTSKNYTYSFGSVIASNVSQYVDFTVSYTANFNTVSNNVRPDLDQQYFSHVGGLQFNLLSKQGWFFQNDLNNRVYTGLGEGFNQNFWLWNLGVGKKFLKDRKGELKLSVFDFLKQNRSISREISDSYIQDVSNRVLTQYFMLTFSYNLRNFGKAAANPRGNSNINNDGFNRGGFQPGGGNNQPGGNRMP